jgi:hypothetical protein
MRVAVGLLAVLLTAGRVVAEDIDHYKFEQLLRAVEGLNSRIARLEAGYSSPSYRPKATGQSVYDGPFSTAPQYRSEPENEYRYVSYQRPSLYQPTAPYSGMSGYGRSSYASSYPSSGYGGRRVFVVY